MGALRVWSHIIKKVGDVGEMDWPQSVGCIIHEVILQKLISIVLMLPLYVLYPHLK